MSNGILIDNLVEEFTKRLRSRDSAIGVLSVLGWLDGEPKSLRKVAKSIGKSHECLRIWRDFALNKPIQIEHEIVENIKNLLEPHLPMTVEKATQILIENNLLKDFNPKGLPRILRLSQNQWIQEVSGILYLPIHGFELKREISYIKKSIKEIGLFQKDKTKYSDTICCALSLPYNEMGGWDVIPQKILRILGKSKSACNNLTAEDCCSIIKKSFSKEISPTLIEDFLTHNNIFNNKIFTGKKTPLSNSEKIVFDILKNTNKPIERKEIIEKSQLSPNTVASLLRRSPIIVNSGFSKYTIIGDHEPKIKQQKQKIEAQFLNKKLILKTQVNSSMLNSGIMTIPKGPFTIEGRKLVYDLDHNPIGCILIKDNLVTGLRKPLRSLNLCEGEEIQVIFSGDCWIKTENIKLKI